MPPFEVATIAIFYQVSSRNSGAFALSIGNHWASLSREIWPFILALNGRHSCTFITVTDFANSCATSLFRRPQDPQGCLEKQNHPLSWNLVVWCAKIGPKTKKVQKTSELAKKMSKNDGFSMVFQSFLLLGPILAHQTTKFEFSG